VRGLTDPRSRLEPFFIEYSGSYLHGDMLPKGMDEPPEVLCLHGEGAEGRSSFLLLRHILLEKHSISSCAFDFYGHGRSCGEGAATGLYREEHLNQAADIVDACFDSQPFSIVAADWSIWVALQLAESFPVRQLVLLNPVDGCGKNTHTPCQMVDMPVEPVQTLTYMNAQPSLLWKVALLVKDTLQGDGIHLRCTY
jgi:Predicted hydrolases or acyltransferases (alpha/beta hydrolase superfamily)